MAIPHFFTLPASSTGAVFYNNFTPTTDHLSHDLRSPTPSTRLTGEPAFCAGRHCCHWSVNGHTCNNHYPSAAALDAHICADHAGRIASNDQTGSLGGDYHCHWAGCTKPESFGNKPKLTRHIHSHTNHKPHSCSYPGCDRAFVTKEQLKNHETTHTKARQHVCPECGKGFAVKTALTSHMNVHKGAKPYVCEECGKGFADSSNLSKHRAIHKRSGVKPGLKRRMSAALDDDEPTTTLPAIMQVPQHQHAYQHHLIQQHHLLPLPSWAAPSVEKFPADYCAGRPCFSAQCEAENRIPCRSVSPCKSMPCSDRGCSIPPCDLSSCPLPAEALCAAQPCDSPDCSLPDCDWADCNFDDCEQQHCHLADCDLGECGSKLHFQCCAEDSTSMSTPSTGQGVSATPMLDGYSHAVPLRHACPAVIADAQDRDIGRGFQHLQAFIHGVNCGCVDWTSR
ncbi:zinc-finger protein [Friedmanniomyces endolithicus]|nr:zinc-finger protein [Friedmanniomyces endolithicus]